MSIRISLAVMAVVVTFASPADAEVTLKSPDGTMEMTFPNGWRETKKSGPNVMIHATGGQSGRVTVRVQPKQDFKDLKSLVNFTAEQLKRKFPGSEPKFEETQVGGKPAVRVIVMGEARSGKRAGYVITLFEGDGVYINVTASANASAFSKQEEVLKGMVNELKFTSSAPETQPQAQTPKTPTPSAAPQTPAPSAAPQPATPKPPARPR